MGTFPHKHSTSENSSGPFLATRLHFIITIILQFPTSSGSSLLILSATPTIIILFPSQFHPQHFPVELPFQLKGISFMLFHDVQHFSVIRNNNLVTQDTISSTCYCFFQYSCMFMSSFFSSPRTDNPFPCYHDSIQNIFKSSSHNICFFSSQESAFYTPWHFNNLVGQTTDKFTNLMSIFKT